MDETTCCDCSIRTLSLVITALSALFASMGFPALICLQEYITSDWGFLESFIAVFLIVYFGVSCIAVYGIISERRKFLLPWIILSVVFVIIGLILIVQFFYKNVQEVEMHGGILIILGELYIGICLILIGLLTINVVRRYYISLKTSIEITTMID